MDDLRPERSPRALTRGLRSVVTQPVRSGRNCLGHGGPSIGAEDFEVNVRLRHVEFVEAAANRLHERRRAGAAGGTVAPVWGPGAARGTFASGRAGSSRPRRAAFMSGGGPQR